MKLAACWIAALMVGSVSVLPAWGQGAGVSHELAINRAARVSEVRYKLSFALKAHAAAVTGHEVLSFEDRGAGDLALDYRDGAIASASLNGKAIGMTLEEGHLRLPASALVRGRNELRVEFTSQAGAAGRAITQYEDRDDGSEYVYTLFVPMDASMAFPCFDQPDLKARFTLAVEAPTEWTVVGNTTATSVTKSGTDATTAFSETRPISTYLFAFAAGPFVNVHPASGAPAVYVRKSQAARAEAEAPRVQQMAVRGIKYLEDYFQQPFPFPKYDLVLIPGFPFGGMEHAGATFLNEDGVLFRTAPTESDRFRRNILVLHETTHQWFGDLVTMRWFDDLWLKEGFAQYMAYKALAELEPAQMPWKHFYEDIKPLAYGIDETEGTTPIFQVIPNLKDAKSAYGAIVYEKAPAVLRQLNFFLGEENFRDGLRLYLKQHAYANAQWADLVGAFAKTGHKDVEAWAKAWILQRGMPEVEVAWTCAAGRTDLVLRQRDVLRDKNVWPVSNEVLLGFAGSVKTVRADWARAEYRTSVPTETCPEYVFANAGDQAYGRFLLDAKSEAFVASALVAKPVADGFLRSMLWGSLWENVHVARSSPAEYVGLALKDVATEEDESLVRIQGARMTTALHAYLSDKGRAEATPKVEAVTADRMLHAPTLGLRIVNYRTFTAAAATPAGLAEVKGLLDGSVVVPGMPLRPLDRWSLVGALVQQGDPDAAKLLAAEKVRDHSGEGQKYAYAVEAGNADLANKDYYFNDYFHNPTRQEDWITASLRPFNAWNQADETESFLKLALDALPKIKKERKIFFLGAWLGAFVGGQHSAEAQALVHSWLAESKKAGLDPDLRLKVLEASDALDRTVMIRRRYPE